MEFYSGCLTRMKHYDWRDAKMRTHWPNYAKTQTASKSICGAVSKKMPRKPRKKPVDTSNEDPAYWERILREEGLGMDRGRSNNVSYVGVIRDEQLRKGEK
jgi:hypothetical protein